MTSKNPHVETIVSLAASLMDGELPPPAGPKMAPFVAAMEALLQKSESSTAYELLGLRMLGLVLERVGADLGAQEVMQKFVRGK